MNLIAVGQNHGCSGVSSAQPAPSSKVLAFPSREIVTTDADSANRDDHEQELQASFPSSPLANSNQSQAITNNYSPTTSATCAPTNSDGFAENPDAYRVWKPQPLEGEAVTPQQFREKLAAMVQGLSMRG